MWTCSSATASPAATAHPVWTVVRRLQRALGLRRGIVGAPDRLVVVDHGPGHQAGLVRRQKSHRARNFPGVDETAKGLCSSGLFQPIRACTMMLTLNPVFAFASHPSD